MIEAIERLIKMGRESNEYIAVLALLELSQPENYNKNSPLPHMVVAQNHNSESDSDSEHNVKIERSKTRKRNSNKSTPNTPLYNDKKSISKRARGSLNANNSRRRSVISSTPLPSTSAQENIKLCLYNKATQTEQSFCLFVSKIEEMETVVTYIYSSVQSILGQANVNLNDSISMSESEDNEEVLNIAPNDSWIDPNIIAYERHVTTPELIDAAVERNSIKKYTPQYNRRKSIGKRARGSLNGNNSRRRSIISSTPLPRCSAQENIRLCFDQATQTEPYEPPPASAMEEIETAVNYICSSFQVMVSQANVNLNDSTSMLESEHNMEVLYIAPNDSCIDQSPAFVEGVDAEEVVEDNGGEQRVNSSNTPRVRRMSAQTTNNIEIVNDVDMVPIGNGNATANLIFGNIRLSFDQEREESQREESFLPPPASKIEEMETVVKNFNGRFQFVVSQANVNLNDSISMSESDHNDEVLNIAPNDSRIDPNNSAYERLVITENVFGEVGAEEVVQDNDGEQQVNSSIVKTKEKFNPHASTLRVRGNSSQTDNNIEIVNDVDMVPIGNGYAKVPARLLNKIDWNSHTTATRKLLQAIFPRRVLATHSLTGKQSPAFLDRPAKKNLDTKLVDDIVKTVSENCCVAKNLVRNCITIKCADEAKLYRNRQQSGRNQQARKPLHPIDENVQPSTSYESHAVLK